MKGLRNWIRKNASSTRSKTPAKGEDRSNSKIKKRAGSKAKQRNSSRGSRHTSPSKRVEKELIEAGLGEVGGDTRWNEDEMFRVNEKLIGRKIEYDGNPQVFASKGFDGVDPHAFRVVGGAFMNSGTNQIANKPDTSQMQPLHHNDNNHSKIADNADDLQPFFGEDGSTPWGEHTILDEKVKVPKKTSDRENTGISRRSKNSSQLDILTSEEKSSTSDVIGQVSSNLPGIAILNMLRGSKKDEVASIILAAEQEENGNVFMTDLEITAKSQKEKFEKERSENKVELSKPLKTLEENEDFIFLKEWVSSLPETKPSTIFGDFHFNTNAILSAMISNR